MASEKAKLSSRSFAVKGSDRMDGHDRGKLSSQSFSAKNQDRTFVKKKDGVRNACYYPNTFLDA